MTRVIETLSERETEDVAARLSEGLRGGETLFLYGDLGAGKTAFVRGLARGLGAPEDAVASPTFVMLTTYPGRLLLHHADLYRLASEIGAEDVGLFDLPSARDVLAIEWPERMRTYPWKNVLHIRLSLLRERGESARRIELP